jgi:DNA/RNA endonuclease YhcR with UshA esterase domain
MTFQTPARSSTKWMPTALAAFCLLAITASRTAAARPHHSISIAAARTLPLGSQVTVEGTVSTPSGAFASSFFDVGFGIQDDRAGIYVSLQTDLHVVPGDRVRVTGVLADSFGLLVLLPDDPGDVDRQGHQRPPEARRVATGAVGESTEGLLVTVNAKITRAPAPDDDFGFKLFVDDGSGELQIFVNLQTGIDVSALALGERVKITGFSSQFEADFEIDPRFPQDVVVLNKDHHRDDAGDACDSDQD